jgi:phosphate starvation-inducible protein PhoH
MARQTSRSKTRSSNKSSAHKEIEEELRQYERDKNQRKNASLTKESFQNSTGVRLTDKQNDLFKGIRNNTLTVVHGPAGTSKAQPLDSPILTPQGWTTMGEIEIGDKVISIDGKESIVIGTYPQGEKEIWEITFSDGSKVECCSDHLWFTQTEADRNNRTWSKTINGERERYRNPRGGSVKTTSEIIETLYTKRDRINHTIPITSPVNFKEQEVEIHPYVMGCLIGDGCFRSHVGFSTADLEIIESIENLIEDDISISQRSQYDYALVKETTTHKNKIKQFLIKLGLWNKLSYEKFIPECYKFNTVENRIELLRGLMDTDGTVSKDGTFVSFCSTSKKLVNDVKEIVQSLGGIATDHNPRNEEYTYNNERRKGRTSYTLTIKMNPDINPFSLKRKFDKVVPKSKYKPIRYIVSAQLIGKKEAKCIKIDHPSHLYLTNNYIVTHNTFTSCYTALSLLADKKIDKIIITKPIQESGEQLGLLPGTVDEKIDPYKQSYYTNFCKILDRATIDWLFSIEEIVFEPLAYMRGSTYDNCIMLLDECFTGDTRIVTEHKTRGSFNYLRIEEIVNRFKSGKDTFVSSWNEKSKIVEKKLVTGVFENGIKDIFEIHTRDRMSPLKTTQNHPFATFKDGEIKWIDVSNLRVGDSLCRYKNEGTNNSTILTNDSYDVILGMLLGDSSLIPNKQVKKSYRIVTNHSMVQFEYMNFKKEIFKNISSFRKSLKSGYTGEPQCGFTTKSINISQEFYDSIYEKSKKFVNSNIQKWFSKRTLAIWYMDDGSVSKKSGCVTFSTNSMSLSEVTILSDILKSKFEIESKIYNTSKGNIISLNKKNSEKLFTTLDGYIHPSMMYKLNGHIAQFVDSLYDIQFNNNISTIEISEIKKSVPKIVYNIEVDGNNNYFAENILVHNCQNASIKQLMLWATRLGKDSKAVMMGDTSQYDVKKRDSGYVDFINMTKDMADLYIFEFQNEDIVRNKFLIELTNRYDKYRSDRPNF